MPIYGINCVTHLLIRHNNNIYFDTMFGILKLTNLTLVQVWINPVWARKLVHDCKEHQISPCCVSSVESQKGAINSQRYSVENQKGAIGV